MISKHNIENKKITIRNSSNIVLEKLKPGQEKKIEVDKIGTPIDKFWRRRLKDSKIDNCIEIVKTKTKKEISGKMNIKTEEILTNGK